MALYEFGSKPPGRALVLWELSKIARQESAEGLKQEMHPRFLPCQAPFFQLMSKSSPPKPRQQVRDFRNRVRYPSKHLVSASTREQDATPPRMQHSGELSCELGPQRVLTWQRGKICCIDFERQRVFPTSIDVVAPRAAFLFHYGEIGALIPVGLCVI